MTFVRHKSLRASLVKPFCVFLIIMGVFSLVLLRSSIKSLEYRLGTLQEKEVNLRKECRNLTSHKDVLLSLANIDDIAKNELGFVIQDRDKTIFVKERPTEGIFQTSYSSE